MVMIGTRVDSCLCGLECSWDLGVVAFHVCIAISGIHRPGTCLQLEFERCECGEDHLLRCACMAAVLSFVWYAERLDMSHEGTFYSAPARLRRIASA